MKKLLFAFLFSPLFVFPQFTFQLKPVAVNNLPGLQSYVYGQSGDYILLLGGRIDGLHQRQPFASFAETGNNKKMYVTDPKVGFVASRDLKDLPVSMQEQLQATNIQFYQKADTLYLVGGYGYSASAGNHITYPYLTTIIVSGLVDAIKEGKSIVPFFKQVLNQQMAVTGGHLEMIKDTFLLVGGNRFDGRYNPMGNPTYTQKYTNQVNRFAVKDSSGLLVIKLFNPWYDSLELHRRDYNLTPTIFVNGEEGFTAWSGVFRYDVDLPYLNSVNISQRGIEAQHVFEQKLNQYHTANFGLFDQNKNEMHTIFFGGIGQYYYNDQQVLLRNDSVPFVKTISKITRQSNGNMNEVALNIQMPGYLGASAELVLHQNLPKFENRVVKFNQLDKDSLSLGFIIGGINSSLPNIFWINNGTQSQASAQVYEVILVKDGTNKLEQSSSPRGKLNLYPNPGSDKLYFEGIPAQNYQLEIFDINGKLIQTRLSEASEFVVDVSHVIPGIYTIKVVSNEEISFGKWIKY